MQFAYLVVATSLKMASVLVFFGVKVVAGDVIEIQKLPEMAIKEPQEGDFDKMNKGQLAQSTKQPWTSNQQVRRSLKKFSTKSSATGTPRFHPVLPVHPPP